jgi:hypothetical protein
VLDVQERFRQLSTHRSELRWYALVDGHQHEQHSGERIGQEPGVNRALFDGTDDEPLAHAGPWLFDLLRSPARARHFAQLEAALPAVSWIFAAMDLEGLAQVLQLKLDATLPDGRTALVRIQDPRVLGNLFTVMDAEQRSLFLHLIEEWHFLYDGQRVWMGRGDA